MALCVIVLYQCTGNEGPPVQVVTTYSGVDTADIGRPYIEGSPTDWINTAASMFMTSTNTTISMDFLRFDPGVRPDDATAPSQIFSRVSLFLYDLTGWVDYNSDGLPDTNELLVKLPLNTEQTRWLCDLIYPPPPPEIPDGHPVLWTEAVCRFKTFYRDEVYDLYAPAANRTEPVVDVVLVWKNAQFSPPDVKIVEVRDWQYTLEWSLVPAEVNDVIFTGSLRPGLELNTITRAELGESNELPSFGDETADKPDYGDRDYSTFTDALAGTAITIDNNPNITGTDAEDSGPTTMRYTPPIVSYIGPEGSWPGSPFTSGPSYIRSPDVVRDFQEMNHRWWARQGESIDPSDSDIVVSTLNFGVITNDTSSGGVTRNFGDGLLAGQGFDWSNIVSWTDPDPVDPTDEVPGFWEEYGLLVGVAGGATMLTVAGGVVLGKRGRGRRSDGAFTDAGGNVIMSDSLPPAPPAPPAAGGSSAPAAPAAPSSPTGSTPALDAFSPGTAGGLTETEMMVIESTTSSILNGSVSSSDNEKDWISSALGDSSDSDKGKGKEPLLGVPAAPGVPSSLSGSSPESMLDIGLGGGVPAAASSSSGSTSGSPSTVGGSDPMSVSLPPTWHHKMVWRQRGTMQYGAFRIRHDYVNPNQPFEVSVTYPSSLIPAPSDVVLVPCDDNGVQVGDVVSDGMLVLDQYLSISPRAGATSSTSLHAVYHLLLLTNCSWKKCKLFRLQFGFVTSDGSSQATQVRSAPFLVTAAEGTFARDLKEATELPVVDQIVPKFVKVGAKNTRAKMQLRCGQLPATTTVRFLREVTTGSGMATAEEKMALNVKRDSDSVLSFNVPDFPAPTVAVMSVDGVYGTSKFVFTTGQN